MSRSNRNTSSLTERKSQRVSNRASSPSQEEKKFSRRSSSPTGKNTPTVVMHTQEEKAVSPFARGLPQAVLANLIGLAGVQDTIRLAITSKANLAANQGIPLDLTTIDLSLTQVHTYFPDMSRAKVIGLNINIEEGEEEMFLPKGLILKLHTLNINIYEGGDFSSFLNRLNECLNLAFCTLGDNFILTNMYYFQNLTKLQKIMINNCKHLNSLLGLGNCLELKELWLEECYVLPNLDGIDTCLALDDIYLTKCKILSEISALSNHTNLRILNIKGDWGTLDVTGLETCNNLKELRLRHFDTLEFSSNMEGKLPSSLEEMTLASSKVTFLEHKVECPNLVKLVLADAENIEDFSFLKECPKLHVVYFNALENVTSLTGINFCLLLKELHIINCKNFIDLEPLKRCKQLQIFEAHQCDSLTDITGLEFNSALKAVKFEKCNITHLVGLRGCTNLEKFECFINPVTSLKGLEQCPELKEVTLLKCPITSLKQFKGCPKLSLFTMHEPGELTSLRGLEACPELTKIIITAATKIVNIKALQNCTKLQTLCLSDCKSLDDISYLSNCINMKMLKLSGCLALSSLKGIENMAKLKHLIMKYTTITKLTSLRQCRKLVELIVDNCGLLYSLEGIPESVEVLSANTCVSLWDISALGRCVRLRELLMKDNTSLTKIDVLSKCVALEKIILGGCSGLKKMDSLVGLPELVTLNISGTNISPEIGLHILNMYN